MTVEKFIQEQTLKHRRPNTIRNDSAILNNIDKFKPIDTCSADDLRAYIIQYMKNFRIKYNRETQETNINIIYSVMKKYYCFMGKPDAVSWIKTKKIMKKLNPDKLLTPSEIQNMLRVWDNSRDKAMLAIAYESGMRLGELLSLRVEDVRIKDGEFKVRIPDNYEGEGINSKTGSRTLVLIESLPYIEKYLNVHDGGKRLFNIQRTRSSQILDDMAAKAGITKNVYWHLLRHTRATEMAKLGMQETAMKIRFGWQEDSSMIKRYTSLTDSDADDAYRNALGLGIKKTDITINPIAKRCSKCGKLIENGEYCPQCSEIQKLTEANTKAQIEKEELKERLDTMKKDMEYINMVIKSGKLDEILKKKN